MINKHEISWKESAKNMLKAELQWRGISYDQLVTKLQAIGVDENYNSVNTKINRGSFSFIFVLQCLTAIGANEIRLN